MPGVMFNEAVHEGFVRLDTDQVSPETAGNLLVKLWDVNSDAGMALRLPEAQPRVIIPYNGDGQEAHIIRHEGVNKFGSNGRNVLTSLFLGPDRKGSLTVDQFTASEREQQRERGQQSGMYITSTLHQDEGPTNPLIEAVRIQPEGRELLAVSLAHIFEIELLGVGEEAQKAMTQRLGLA